MTLAKPNLESEIVQNICADITKATGVQLGPAQQNMVLSRLRRRISELHLKTIADYYKFYQQNYSSEVQSLISLLTTHHSFFFREFAHFNYLEKFLPELVRVACERPDRTIRVWSAACSRGQEVYSLAMFFKFHLAHTASEIKFKIFGTDIDPQSIAIAKNGVYLRDEIKSVPLNYLGPHWVRGTGEISNYVKVKKSLKEHCQFSVFNLTDSTQPFSKEYFDVIFCRNVFIYFDSKQIEKTTQNLLSMLRPGGLFFIGVSESLGGLNLKVRSVGPSIYTHLVDISPVATIASHPSSKEVKTQVSKISSPEPPTMPAVLRVLCVDDSKSIHTLLKRILTREFGFEIVGTALNGIEAAQKLKELKPDVMTLDIHMPEQTGVEYLAKNFSPQHPPVVMVTSVSRENSDLAIKALSLGASDYVEKPALDKLTECGEEIRTKLKCAYMSRKLNVLTHLSLDKSFAKTKTILNPESKLRLIVGHLADRDRIAKILNEFTGPQPPTYVLFQNSTDVLREISKNWGQKLSSKVIFSTEIKEKGKSNQIYVADFSQSIDPLFSIYSKQPTSILVFGEISHASAEKILRWSNCQLLIEDLGHKKGTQHLSEVASDIVPVTSFPYMSCEYLADK